MNLKALKTTQELQLFMDGTQAVAFELPRNKSSCYSFIQKVLKQFCYTGLKKSSKGIVIKFLIQVTGYSRQQLTRLINQYSQTGVIKKNVSSAKNGFKQKYTTSDIDLLIKMDERYGTPSGAVIKKLCERSQKIFNLTGYENLAQISVSHLYNLRKNSRYKKKRRLFEKTRSRKNSIGTRRKPDPDGKPGYIRIDTVHQGDQDGLKGVYHINAVDEVTQYEIVLSCSRISEKFLIPVLEEIIELFPFKILGFHADNGSEYINHKVANLLDMLRIELTKSRSRQSNDNALAESKNASVVRKIYGFNHIPRHFACDLNDFNRRHLIPFLNFHRPCYFPAIVIDEKGKQRKKYYYKDMMTPYEKLKSLTNSEKYLKADLSFDKLDEDAYRISDNQAADKMNRAKRRLFKRINEQKLA